MAQYKIGTISITSGTNTVTGVGTQFLTNVSVGDSFKVYGVPALYGVIAVDSNTQLRISPNYAGATVSGGQYQVTTDFTASLGLAEISMGDSEFAFHLTHEVIRKLDVAVAGKAPLAGPGSSQSFTVGALTATSAIIKASTNTTVTVAGDAAEGNAYINFSADSDVTKAQVRGMKAGATGGGLALATLRAGVLTEAVRLLDNGNLLVNTATDAAAKLAVKSGGISTYVQKWLNSAGVYIGGLYETGAGHSTLYLADSLGADKVYFSAMPSQAHVLNNGGNLLINTTTDNGSGAKLQVNGDVTTNDLTFNAAGKAVSRTGTTVAHNAYLDVPLNTGGGSFSGFIAVCNSVVTNAVQQTQTLYSVLGRGTDYSTSSLSTRNGVGGAATFTVTCPSTGVIRITNTSGVTTRIDTQFIGGLGL